MILVTGATGYIGSRLVNKLLEDGHKVRALVVKNDPLLKQLEAKSCEIVYGDITRPETLPPCFKGIKTLFHLAAVLVSNNPKLFHQINYEGTKNVIDAAVEAEVEHVICLSAAAATYKTKTTYGRSKAKSEELMKQRGKTNFTIVRPALLFGDGGSSELKIYAKNLRKFPFITPLVGSGNARKRPVWVGDIINGLALLVNKPVTYGKIYNFTGGTDVSMKEYTRLICDTFGIKKPILPIPVWACSLAVGVLNRVSPKPLLTQDQILGVIMDANNSYEEAAQDIGYQPVDLYEKFRDSFINQEGTFKSL